MAEQKTTKKATTKATTTKSTAKAAPKKKAAAKKTATPKKTATKAPKKVVAKESPTTTGKKENYSNDAVKVTLTQSEGCSAHLEVTLTSKTLDETYTQALKEVSKSISLPGFRKGKVPKALVEKNYEGSIREQQAHIQLQKGIDEALALTKLRPLNYRNIQPKIEKQTQMEVVFSYSFESYPQIPPIPVEKIQLDKVPVEEITDEKVEEVIDVMRSYQAKWEPIKDRAIETGDFVDLDILNLENDTKLVSNKRVQVEKGKVSQWLLDMLVGMKKEESKEGKSKWDDSLPATDKKDFKSTKCKVTVLGIFKGDLPPVDEKFAKAMGTQSVAELRTQVLLRLTKNAESARENQQKALLDKALEKLVDFDLPTSLLEAEQKTKLRLKEQESGSKKKLSEKDEKEAHQEAKVALKLFFILQKLANDNNIIVSEQELRDVLSERLSHLNLPKELSSNQKYKNQLIQEMRMNCFIDILTEKVKLHLLKQVTVEQPS